MARSKYARVRDLHCKSGLLLQQTSCAYNKAYRGASMSGYIKIQESEDSLQAAVASTGPVAVAVDASSNAFKVCCVWADTASN